MMNITAHSIERTMERCNIKNSRTAVKNISLAVERGMRAENCSSWERTFLMTTATENSTAIAYNNYCYILDEKGYCVTVYPLPAWFGKKKRFNGKEKIRNYKKYNTKYSRPDMEMDDLVC